MYDFEAFQNWLEFNPEQRERVRDSLESWTEKNRRDWLSLVFQAKEEDYWDPVNFPHLAALKKWAIGEEQLARQLNCENCSEMRKRVGGLEAEIENLQIQLITERENTPAAKEIEENLQAQLESNSVDHEQLLNLEDKCEELENEVSAKQGKIEKVKKKLSAWGEMIEKRGNGSQRSKVERKKGWFW
ncbi:MAG: hypothetical protein I3274_02790 [Candidatus Moeniiplasma glomeromycotorum]|nr:hypothetical protein [Candidatus Moeniiplasma glomeromycotorum]MCE8167532.1 hypothetical protein [Candidatus Moeniiplasma glomeromycotorum]